MEMSQIRYFIAVSETLNFTRAAEQCCISQPALTKGIKKLESIIGGELLYRTKSTVELSELGRLLLPNFKDIYLNAQQTKEEAQRILRREAPKLRIGFHCSIAFESISQIIAYFRHGQPGVDVVYQEGPTEELDEKLRHHEIDVFFDSRISPERACCQAAVSSDAFVVVFDSRHTFASQTSLALKHLNNEKLLVREHCESSTLLQEALANNGYSLRGLCFSRRDDWISNFIRCDKGIAIVPRALATASGLPFLHLVDFPLYQTVYAVRRTDDSVHKNAYVDAFFYSLLHPAFPAESVA